MKTPIKIKGSEIVISKSFAKKAYCFGTPEYEMLQTVRRDYPEFKVVLREIKKNTNVDHYKGVLLNLAQDNLRTPMLTTTRV